MADSNWKDCGKPNCEICKRKRAEAEETPTDAATGGFCLIVLLLMGLFGKGCESSKPAATSPTVDRESARPAVAPAPSPRLRD